MRQYSLQTIKKSVDMKSKLEEAILGSGSARSEMMMRRRNTTQLYQGIVDLTFENFHITGVVTQ